MSVLAEFLNREATRLAAEKPTREAELAEWRAAVDALFAQLTRWVKAADPHGVVTLTSGQTTLRERRLGVYTMPTLAVEVDGETVKFVPKSRGVLGGVLDQSEGGVYHTPDVLTQRGELPFEGLVDIMAWGAREESLYRVRVDGKDVWLVMLSNPDGPFNFRYAPFTQARFERLLVRVLQ